MLNTSPPTLERRFGITKLAAPYERSSTSFTCCSKSRRKPNASTTSAV